MTLVQRLEFQCLVENWVRLELYTLVDDPYDQEWDFENKDKDEWIEKKIRSSDDAILWPQSSYLPDLLLQCWRGLCSASSKATVRWWSAVCGSGYYILSFEIINEMVCVYECIFFMWNKAVCYKFAYWRSFYLMQVHVIIFFEWKLEKL